MKEAGQREELFSKYVCTVLVKKSPVIKSYYVLKIKYSLSANASCGH